MARSTFVKAEGQGAELVQRLPDIASKSFVPPVAPFEYGKRLRQQGAPVWECASAVMEQGWRAVQRQ